MISIAYATPDDVCDLVTIGKTLFQENAISERQMRNLLKSETAAVVKAALYNTAAIGCMVLIRRQRSDVLRIALLGVLEEYRNIGVGRQLLQFAEGWSARHGCDCLQLEIQMKNKAALIFSLAAGYGLHGRKDGFYSDGTTALLLRKQLHAEVCS